MATKLFICFLPWILLGILYANKGDLQERRIVEVTEKIQYPEVESLTYGVYMKKTDKVDVSSSTWEHIFRIPRLPPPPRMLMKQLCNYIPEVENIYEFYKQQIRDTDLQSIVYYPEILNRTRHLFCASHSQLKTSLGKIQNFTFDQNQEYYNNLHAILGGSDNTTQQDPNLTPSYTTMTYADEHDPETIREKRGLINLVGKAGKALFGFATDDDTKTLRADVMQILHNQLNTDAKFMAFQGEMTSVLDVHWDRLDHLSLTLNNTLYKMIHLQALHASALINDQVDQLLMGIYFHALMELMGELIMTQHAYSEYTVAVRDQTAGVIRMHEGFLSSELITVPHLREALQLIQPILQEKFTPFRFAFGSLSYFYTTPIGKVFADKHYIYVKIKIPLTVLNSNYHVYEVLSVPMQASKSPKYYTQLTNLPTYVGFSNDGDTYATFDSRFLRTCLGRHVKRCTSRVAEISTTVPSCILGLFLQDASMAAEFCTSELIITTSLSEQILDVGDGKFFLSANSTGDNWVIQCPNQRPRVTQPCSSCVVTLGCRCSLKTKSAFISASLQNCNAQTETSGIHRSYIPNLTWITKLADYSGFTNSQYSMTSHLLQDPILHLPELPLPSYDDAEEFNDKDSLIRTSLDRVISLAKANKPLYATKMHEISSRTKVNGSAIYVAGLALVWVAALTVAFIVGGKYLCYLVVSIKQLNMVQSAPIDRPYIPLPFSFKLAFWYLVFIMTFYIMASTAYIIWRWYIRIQANRNYHPLKGDEPIKTEMYLKLWTPFKMVTLWLDEVCIPIENLKVAENKHNTIALKLRYHAWSTQLAITWAGTFLQQSDGPEIPFPGKTKVPRHLVGLANAILSSNMMTASVLLKCGPTQKEHKFSVRLLQETPRFLRKQPQRREQPNGIDYSFEGHAVKRPRPDTLALNPLYYDLTTPQERQGPTNPNDGISGYKRFPMRPTYSRKTVRTNPRARHDPMISGVLSDSDTPRLKSLDGLTDSPSPNNRISLPSPTSPPPPRPKYKRQFGHVSMANLSDLD